MRNGRGDGANGQWGWGEPLTDFFDSAKMNVVNRAVGGLSSKTYLTYGYWDSLLALLKPGDYLLIQFGHNDDGPIDDNQRARGTLHGVGEESREIDNPVTGQHEIVHTYGWYLRKFVREAREKGARPMICSPVPRKVWADGKIARGKNRYAGWAQEVARAEGVPFLDLEEAIARRYEQLGPQAVEALFADERTHTTRAGAELNAECVVACLKGLKENPLAPYFSPKAGTVQPFME